MSDGEAQELVPGEFYQWSNSARRAWISGALTQRQMLTFASTSLGLDCEFPGEGKLTNAELARFVVSLTATEGGSNYAL